MDEKYIRDWYEGTQSNFVGHKRQLIISCTASKSIFGRNISLLTSIAKLTVNIASGYENGSRICQAMDKVETGDW